MPALPTGTIALLFTDVEGFTSHCATDEAATLAALRRHDAVVRKAIESSGGVVFKTVGDAFHAAFPLPRDALLAAIEAQRRLETEQTGSEGPILRVRMALHIGSPELREDDYFGVSVNQAARIRDLGHGGQIIVSRAFYEMVNALATPDVTFRSLSAWHIKGVPQPETVFQVVTTGLPASFPPLRAVPESAGNLPVLLSSFVGRTRSLRQVAQQVEQHKLVTLRGAGGCGKTRLAIESARPLGPGFPGGVWFVRLDGLDDPSLIAREAARALRLFLPPGQTAEETLVERLQNRHTLLILDNCEHLLAGCARFVHDLLTVCPDLRILATSREPLGVPGEFVRDVPPLPLPRGIGRPSLSAVQASEAVQLFTARAEASRGFSLTKQNAAAVGDICQALDGIPLALELAARWVGVLPLDDIAHELGELINEPPDDNDPGLVPARQRTMRAAIDWSFQRLNATEQALFLRLAVFVGGFTLDASRAIAGEASGSSVRIFRLLKSLVDRSLLVFDEGAKPDPRYRLLEPIREFAGEKLVGTAEEREARDRHHDWFLGYGFKAEPELQGAASALWLDRLEVDYDNLRAALKWSKDPASRLRLAVALHRFWLIRGHLTEGRSALKESLEPKLSPDLRVTGLNAAGILAYVEQDYTEAERLFRETQAIYSSLRDLPGEAKSLNNLGLTQERMGNYEEAKTLFEKCLAIYRKENDDAHIASVLSNLGMVAYQCTDYGHACIYFQESLTLHRASSNHSDLAVALHNLGMTLFDKGDFSAARDAHTESLHIRCGLKHEQGIVDSLIHLAFSLSKIGNAPQAVLTLAAAANLLQTAPHVILTPEFRARYDIVAESLRSLLGDPVFQEQWECGQQLTPAEIVEPLSSAATQPVNRRVEPEAQRK